MYQKKLSNLMTISFLHGKLFGGKCLSQEETEKLFSVFEEMKKLVYSNSDISDYFEGLGHQDLCSSIATLHGKFQGSEVLNYRDLEYLMSSIEILEDILDEGDSDDCFGTEGWKHHFLFT